MNEEGAPPGKRLRGTTEGGDKSTLHGEPRGLQIPRYPVRR